MFLLLWLWFGFGTFTETVLELAWHCFQVTHASCTICASFHCFSMLVNCRSEEDKKEIINSCTNKEYKQENRRWVIDTYGLIIIIKKKNEGISFSFWTYIFASWQLGIHNWSRSFSGCGKSGGHIVCTWRDSLSDVYRMKLYLWSFFWKG